jgi:rifampicin phosphotransferase
MAKTADQIEWPEVDGFWAFDKMHAPRPVTPLSFDIIVTTLGEGFTKAQAEYNCPMVADTHAVNNYFYMDFHPADEAELAKRGPLYADTLARKVPKVGPLWDEEWKPLIKEANEASKWTDYAGLSDPALAALLDERVNWMRHQWWVHGHINFALLSGAAFTDFYDEVMQPSEPTEAYQVLQGWHTRSVDATREIWTLSRKVRGNATLKKAFAEVPSKQLVAELEKSADGKAFLADLRVFLDEYGWRSDAVYDIADVTWREQPSIPLSSIAGYVEMGDENDPEALYQSAVTRREGLLAKVRAKLASDPAKLKDFEAKYDAAKYSFPVTEDHAFYIDQLGVAVIRRYALHVGARLAEKGVIAKTDDVFFLKLDEVRSALLDGGDRKAIAKERREFFDLCGTVTPPGALGMPPSPPPGTPPDPFMDAVAVRLLGVVPPMEGGDPNVLQGVAGAPGTYTGTARVVKSLDEAGDMEEGEVMVCEMTLPPWVPFFSICGAVVSDVGGVLSHCAIVAREFGVPAVVGTVNGTVAIKTGQTVTVDGKTGTVTIHV